MIRVLNISNKVSVEGGGVARCIREFAPPLRDQGTEVLFAGNEQNPGNPDGIAEVFYCPELGGEHPARAAMSLKDIVSFTKPDVVHVHDVANARVVIPLLDKIPLVVHMHNYGMWCPAGDWFHVKQEGRCSRTLGWKCIPNAYTKRCNNRHPSRLLGSMLGCSKRRSLLHENISYIIPSNYARSAAVQYGGIPKNQLTVVPNAIDGSRFEEAGKPPEIEACLRAGYLLYVGRLAESKGISYLLQAYGRLEREKPRLVIVGDGYYRPALEEQIRRLGLESEVVVAGWQSGPALVWLYRNCRMLIVPSVWEEVFGIVGLEAMAAKKPVVAFDVGGISEWLTHGENGYLVPVKDTEVLASRMQKLIAQPELAEGMGERGFEQFQQRFAVEQQARLLLEVYKRTIDRFRN